MPKNQIKDISVLSKITKLSTIDLQDNKIEDPARWPSRPS